MSTAGINGSGGVSPASAGRPSSAAIWHGSHQRRGAGPQPAA